MRVKPQRHRISVSLNSILFPVTEPEFSDLLRDNGYSLTSPMPRIFPHGQRPYISGQLAMKNDCMVDVDSNRNLVGCVGQSVLSVITTIEELISILSKDFHVNLKNDLTFIESISDLVVTSEMNPLKVMGEFSSKNALLKEFDEILGIESSFMGIDIVPKGINPNTPKWLEIKITPRYTAAKREYYVQAIFRDKEIKKVVDFSRGIDSKVMKLIKVIEGN